MADQILPKGIRFFNKHQNAPDFVIGTAVITLNEFVAFCKENESLLSEYNGQKQIRLQVLKSKDGNLYCAVDTYKNTQDAAPAPASQQGFPVEPADAIDDLPF